MTCRYSRDHFCVICAKFIDLPTEKNKITGEIYDLFFVCYNYDLIIDKDTPTSICKLCKLSLINCFKGIDLKLKISSPAIFFRSNSDHSDCFFCLAKPENEDCFPDHSNALRPVFN